MGDALNRAYLEAYLRSPLSRYEPWTFQGRSPQSDFITAAAQHHIRVFRSGNRCGKTTTVCADALLHSLGWHPFSRHKPGPQRWWFSGLDWDFGIGQVMWPTLREFLCEKGQAPGESPLIKSITWRRKADPQLPLSVRLINDSVLEFKSADGGARKYQGAKLHGCVVDEEHDREIVEEIQARLLDYSGYLSLSLTPVRRLKWVTDMENNKRLNVFSVRASTMDAAKAGIIPLKTVEDWAASLTEDQRRVRVYGDYVSLEGAVWPKFRQDKHVATPENGKLMIGDKELCSWPLPNSWPRYAAIDFGYDVPTAVTLAAHDQQKGRLIVYRVYYARGIRAHTWGKHLRRVLPKLDHPISADWDAMARAELEAQGIPTVPARKEVQPGLELVDALMGPARDGMPMLVFVHDGFDDPKLGRCDASHLTSEIEGYQYSKPRKEGKADAPDKPVKANDHACDSVRYLCAAAVVPKQSRGAGRMKRIRIGW